MALKILRPQHGPDEIDEESGADRAAEDQVEHFYTFSQAGT
jgi:hypothetical protein